MKKKIFSKVLGLSMLGAVSIMGVSALTSCDSVEKIEIKEVNNYGVAPVNNEGIALASSINWNRISNGMTIPKGSMIHYNGNTYFDGGNDDYHYLKSIISSEFDNDFSKCIEKCVVCEQTSRGEVYYYDYSFDDSNINIVVSFVLDSREHCGDSWFPESPQYDASILGIELKLDGTSVFYADMTLACPDVCDYGVITTQNTDYYIELENDLIISNDNTLYNFIFTTCLSYSGDFTAPNFNVSSYYIPVNVDSPLSYTEILSQIGAYDDTDGDVSSSLKVVSTTYKPDNLSLGNHDFKISAQDSSGNVGYATFTINVYDLTKPTIIGESNYSVVHNSGLTLQAIKDSLTLSDNFDSSLSLNVISDDFSGNENKLGNYTIKFNTSDDSGNISDTFVVNVEVKDIVAPVITAPSVIEIATSRQLTSSELKYKIGIVDDYDGKILDYTISGFEDYFNNYRKVGSYPIIITAQDSSGNSSNFTITIKTNDGFAPEFWVYSDFVIQLPIGTELTTDMIISYLSQIGEIDVAEIVSITYDCDINKVGVYDVKIVKVDGSVYTTSISVVDSIGNEEVSNSNWFINLWETICSWFSNIWDWFIGLFTDETNDEVVEPETPENENQGVITQDNSGLAIMNDEEIIDNEFVVYEYPDFDCGNEPAVMPEYEEVEDTTPSV